MDGVPPPRHHLAARPAQQSEKITVTFKGGRLVLEGEGWIGPMKSYVPGWTSARKYAKGLCSVQVAYKDSVKDVESLRQALASGKVDSEIAKLFVPEPIESIKLVRVESISEHQLLLIETESKGKSIKSLVTESGGAESSQLVKLIISDSKDSKDELRECIIRSIKFDK